MDLNSGQLITRNIVHQIPVTDVVIKAVEAMAYRQGFKSLKFYNRNGVIYHDADWIEGVDYDEIETDDEDNDDQYYYDNEEDDEIEDQLEGHEQIDPDEIDDIIQDERQNVNPNEHETDNNANKQENQPEQQQAADTAVISDAEDNESQATESTRRSTRETRPIQRLEPSMSGKLYMQQRKKVTFQGDVDVQLEYCHNLVIQTKPDEDQNEEYSQSDAMLMARLINDRNNRTIREERHSLNSTYSIKD